MDYNLTLSQLQQASLFELFRLQSAIGKLLNDPTRLMAIKRVLKPGMEITYFGDRENRLIPARIIQVRKTRASVEDLNTGKRWSVALHMINLEHQNTDITPKHEGVDRLTLRIGDMVGFIGRDDQELFGVVTKLNPKRAKVKTDEGIWNVPYSMLFTVIDGKPGDNLLIPAKPETSY
jgi:hypothetical protein